MPEPYILVSDQDEDWKPVIKNFISEMALKDLVEIKKEPRFLCNQTEVDKHGNWIVRPKYGDSITKIVLSKQARESGHRDIQILFSQWFNKTGIFFNPYKKDSGAGG